MVSTGRKCIALFGAALLISAALPGMSQSQDRWRPTIEEIESKLPLKCGGDSGTKRIEITARSPADCREALRRKINRLSPEQFFQCEGECEQGSECIAKFDTDCINYSIGGQSPPGRCVYRNPTFPPLWTDSEGHPLDYDPNPMVILDQKWWRCGFVVEAKGRCACVKVPVRQLDSEYTTSDEFLQ